MIRYYILPIEETAANERGPKYFDWWHDPDPPALMDASIKWSMMDYGLINAALLVAEVTQIQHDLLVAQPDVVSPPENIDQNIGPAAVTQVQAALEALRIPADWVDTTFTYREILRRLAGLFQFAQRYHGLHAEQLIDNVGQLDLRWNQIPLDRRARLTATADALGYDYSAVTNQWLIRRILMYLGDQWGQAVFILGGMDL